MKELMSRMEKMEKMLDQQIKDDSESIIQSNLPNSFQNQYVPRGRGCAGYRSSFQRCGYRRGYQGSSNHINYHSIMLTRTIILKEAIEVVVVLGVVPWWFQRPWC